MPLDIVKAVAVSGSGQAVKESLHSVILEQFVEWPFVDPCTIEEALSD